MAFGFGPHQCLGQSLPAPSWRSCTRRCSGGFPLRLAVTLDELAVKDDGFVYGLHELPVTW